MSSNKAVFFPGINSLRFFAALAVIITHVELLKGIFGFAHQWYDPVIFNLGGLGVYFFFVLSGFLITFLLLKEKDEYKTINIKAFYVRRILRIWPLYYFIVLLGFFVLPYFPQIRIDSLEPSFDANFTANLVLYLLILPNVAFSLYPAVPHIGQVWSIGIEEQFYIVWPWVIRKAKNTVKALITIVVLIVVAKIVILVLGVFYPDAAWFIFLKKLAAMSKFECMAIGGIGAYYLHTQNQKVLKIIHSSFALNISLILIPLLIYFTPDVLQNGIHLVFAILFLVIIMNVASNKKLWLDLENKYFAYLGKISYGIYMYHFMVIPIVLYLSRFADINSDLGFNLLVYSGSILLTIAVSGLSYSLLEKRFIKLKSKYAVIRSGEKGDEP